MDLKKLEDNIWKTIEFDCSLHTLIKDSTYSPDQPFPNILGTKWISADPDKPDYYELFSDSISIFYDSNLEKSFAGKFYIYEKFQLCLFEDTIIDDPTFNWDVTKNFISYNNKLIPLNQITPDLHNTKFYPNYYFILDTSYITRETPNINQLLKHNYDSILDTPGLIKYEEICDSTGKVVQKSYSFQFQRNKESSTVVNRAVSDFDINLEILEIEDNSKIITSDFSNYTNPILENFVRPAFKSEEPLTGYASVSFYILPDNSVSDVEIVSTTNNNLEEYVLKVVKENTFKAACDQRGNPVKAWVLMTIFFA